MVSVHVFGLSGRQYCTSPHSGVNMGTGKFNAGGNHAMDHHPNQEE